MFPTPLMYSCSVILVEQQKLAELHRLDEELEDMKKQEQLETKAAETQEQ